MLTRPFLRGAVFPLFRSSSRSASVPAVLHIDARCFSENVTDKPKIQNCRAAVLLLHHGQPRTPYYAKQFLASRASHFYKVPLPVAS